MLAMDIEMTIKVRLNYLNVILILQKY